MEFVQINDLFIPLSEIRFSATRSSGPGGQHVNKVSSRVVLEFSPAECSVFSEEQKQQLMIRLRSRLTKEGILQISAQEYRSQHANKELALAKLIEILEEALRPPKKRRRTRIPLAARFERLQNKKHRSLVKERRRPVNLD